jgi:hypothetical protein
MIRRLLGLALVVASTGCVGSVQRHLPLTLAEAESRLLRPPAVIPGRDAIERGGRRDAPVYEISRRSRGSLGVETDRTTVALLDSGGGQSVRVTVRSETLALGFFYVRDGGREADIFLALDQPLAAPATAPAAAP